MQRISQILDRLPQSIEKLSISLPWDKDLLDEDILVLFQNITYTKFPYLKILDLDFGNSSLDISVLTDKSAIFIANSISTFSDSLWIFNLNLYCCGLSNPYLTDRGVKTLVESISQLSNLAKLYLNFFGWGEQKPDQISDRAVKEISVNISELHNAQCIEIDLGWQRYFNKLWKIKLKMYHIIQLKPTQNIKTWGEKNPSVTSKSLKYISDMIDSLFFVRDLSLNLNQQVLNENTNKKIYYFNTSWANKNTKIADTDVRAFFKCIMNWRHLQKLYLNIQEQITYKNIIQLGRDFYGSQT